MPNLFQKKIILTTAMFIAFLSAAPAYAIFPKLSTNLSGAAINGVTPSGKAAINQANYPTIAATLAVNVSKVNLPNGTVLAVNLSDCRWFGPVAYINIVGGSASVSVSLPGSCQIGRASSISISNSAGSVIMNGGSPWKI